MSDMVRCPNCLRELSGENRFCIFCGCPLSDIGPETEPAEAAPAPVPSGIPCFCPKGHDVPDPSLGFCPVCGSILTGEPPVSEMPFMPEEPPVSYAAPVPAEPPMYTEPPVPVPPAVPVPSASPLIRRCSCGYECDDPELNFCPACGIPLPKIEPAPVAVEGDWICADCGAMNRLDMNFCTGCGHPKSKRTAPESEPAPDPYPFPEPDPGPAYSSVAPRRGDRTVIPEGMYIPTDDDLAVKAKYGN